MQSSRALLDDGDRILTVSDRMPHINAQAHPLVAVFNRPPKNSAGRETRSRDELQKIIALLFGDWFLESFEHLQHVFPDFSFF